MNTKLTLKLNRKSIERAKRFAVENNESLSSLVERYFNLMAEKENIKSEIEISPNVLELSGVIQLDDKFDLKDEYGDHLIRKYG